MSETLTLAPARRRVSLLATVLACEARLLKRDLGWWLTLALMLLCALYALGQGQARVMQRQATVAAAQADESRRLIDLRNRLARIESGQTAVPAQAHRDPTNPLSVGRGAAATVAHLEQAPLAAWAVGLSDLFPPSFTVKSGSMDSFLFVDEIANPAQLLTGSFDLAFVLVCLYPLLLLALSYNLLSGEREQGTLALSAASSAPLVRVLGAKLALRGGAVVLVALLTLALSALQLPGVWSTGDGLLALAAGLSLVLLWGLFWLLLAFWVNSWGRDSAFNAVSLLMAWVLLLVVLPATVNGLAQAWHPTPPRAEIVLAVRQAAVDAERDADAADARYREEHGEAAPKQQRSLSVLLAADRRADDLLTAHEAQAQAQRRLSDGLSWFSPALRVQDALAELAGAGHSRWDAHLQDIQQFHAQWQAFFVSRAQRGERLKLADLPALPRFQHSVLPVWQGETPVRVGGTLMGLLALCGALALAARQRLSRAWA